MKPYALILCLGMWSALFLSAVAQTIPPHRLVTWSKAGLPDTLPDFGNVVNIMQHGAAADGVTPDDNALAAAIAALGNRPGTVYIPAGTYLFTLPVVIERDSLIIKGDGATTRLLFNADIPLYSPVNIPGRMGEHPVPVQGNVYKNDSFLVITGTIDFRAGDYIYLSDSNEALTTSAWALGWAGQILRLQHVNNDTLFLHNTVRRNYSKDKDITIRPIRPVSYVGLECFYIENLDLTVPRTNNMEFLFAANCWATGIESNMANYAHLSLRASTHILVRGCYFHHAHSYGWQSEGYGVIAEFATGDCLVENNIFEHLRHAMVVQAGANGNVLANNYSTDPYWVHPPNASDGGADIVCHGDYPYLNLFEGNIGQHITVDNAHGINGPYNTFFRNRVEGYGIFGDALAADSTNYIANEITGGTGKCILAGKGYFEQSNNLRGVIIPSNSVAPVELSLYAANPPGYWPGKKTYPSIGAPQPYNANDIPAKARFQSGNKTDCTRNPEYISVKEVQVTEPLVTVSPNPFNDCLWLTISEIYTSCRYSLVDFTGRTLQTGSITAATKVDTKRLPCGLYLLEIAGEKGTIAVKKIIKATN